MTLPSNASAGAALGTAGTTARRVLIVEDNESLATGLRHNLEYEGYAVTVVGEGRAGLEAVARERPDLVILDVMLPDLDGYQVLRTLREAGDETPVLMLTARADESDKVRGLRVGADDYVTKPFGLMELLARVDALLRRLRPAAAPREAPLRFGEVVVDPATHAVTRAGQPVPLRPREYDLLLALLQRDGRVASREELLHQVWGYDESVVSRTVDTHIAELRRKLEADPARPVHLLTVRKAGYRLVTVPEEGEEVV